MKRLFGLNLLESVGLYHCSWQETTIGEVTVKISVTASKVHPDNTKLLVSVLNDVSCSPGVHHVATLGVRHVESTADKGTYLVHAPGISGIAPGPSGNDQPSGN